MTLLYKVLSMKKVLAIALPPAAVAVVLSLVVYAAVQQDLRQSANDPQIALAEDLAARLGAGEAFPPPVRPVDLARTLLPFTQIYASEGSLLWSSAMLDGASPRIPPGVLGEAARGGENRVTWQPRPGVREALVVTHFTGSRSGFVASGRSLREVEQREAQTLHFAAMAALVAIVAAFALSLLTSQHVD